MFISIAAVALDKYEWFKYTGRRTVVLENHNKKHDLELETNDRFGVRKYGSKFKLVDITAPTAVFTLTEKEVSALVKKSKGYKATVKGVKLSPGVGGRDRVRKPKVKTKITHRTEGDTPTRDPKYFPNFPMPPKKADIMRLYTYFNKVLFNNGCPSSISILFSEALKFSGQAQAKWKNNDIKFTLKISKRALTDRLRVLDILLHEMIHLSHYQKYLVDGDSKYAKAGHGPLFVQDMERLNRFGYNIRLVEDSIKEAILSEPEYVLALEMQDSTLLCLHSQKPFKGDIDVLLEDIRKQVAARPLRFVYGTSENSYVFLTNRLTARNTLKGNRRLRNLRLSSKEAQAILNSIDVQSEETLVSQKGDVRSSVESGIDRAVDYIDHPINTYAVAVLSSSGLWPKGQRVPISKDDILTILTADEYALMLDRWNSAEDRHFIKGSAFTEARKVLLKHRLDGEDALEYMAQVFDKFSQKTGPYYGRVDASRFARISIEALGDIITLSGHEIRDGILRNIKM